MTKLYLNFFYKFLAVLTLIVITEDTDYYRRNFENIDLKGFSSLFNTLNLPSGIMIPALLAMSIPVLLWTARRPSMTSRLVSFFSFWFVCSFLANFTHFNTPRAPWILAALVMVAVNPAVGLHQSRNRLLFTGIQDMIFANYILAGIWKILHLADLSSFADFIFSVSKAPWEHMAYVTASGSANPSHIELIQKVAPIVPAVFLGFVLLQIGSFIPVIWTKLKIPWAYLLIAFHLFTAVAMGLTFDYAIAGLLIMVILIEELRGREKSA